MQYFLILGKNPLLSKAEIEAVLNFYNISFKNSQFFGKVLIIQTSQPLDINLLNSRLGGTVKIGKILARINNLEEFEDRFFKSVDFGNGKVFFGFSLYALTDLNLLKYQKQLTPLAMEIKRILREEKNINSRYVVSREIELSSVIVAKNKLLKNGAEICFFVNNQEILFGQTLAVQEFEEFGARDFTRPGRDQVSGMLPPKLARIMINLSQLATDKVILDPFCGSGTILQEAIILGHQNLIGTDNSSKAIEDTKQNLEWLINKYGNKIKSYKIAKVDVKNLNNNIESQSIDAIITEPYLGPALKGSENTKQLEIIIKELETLFYSAFLQFYKILKPKGKVVCIFPIFKIMNLNLKLAILTKIENIGFKILNKDDLIYSREKQKLWREILIFQK